MQTTNAAALIRGENNALEHSAESVGDGRVALFFALVRGIADDRIVELMDACLGDQAESDLAEIVADLCVMAMQTRDCRGGKGERALCYKMLLHLYKKYPRTVLQLLSMLSEYGYYKDYFQLYELTAGEVEYAVLRNKILDIVANQLIADEAVLEEGSASGRKVSLCAKYCPREGKHFDAGAGSAYIALVNKLFPAVGAQAAGKKQYRQLVAKLTKVLNVPEVKMCGKRFSELEFSKVPSVCAKKFAKAFLNEELKRLPTAEEEETGNRCPDDEDRILCRQHLRQAAIDKKVKGGQVYPHEIVQTLMGDDVSSLQQTVLDAQWTDIRRNLLLQLEAAAEAAGDSAARASTVNVGKLVPLSDVSGSMSGIPMQVSIALGILVSEVNHPAFRDRVLTFDSNPEWCDLSGLATIAEKVETLQHAPWGGSTDVNKAFELIRDVVRAQRLPAEEVPDLIVFSDMQFDDATCVQASWTGSSWAGDGEEEQGEEGESCERNDASTQLELVRRMFAEVGVEICGTPYGAPKIIFWNLRGDTRGFPAQAADENVQMLSGFSPALLKAVLEGGEIDALGRPTPYQTLRKVLDDARYHPVRELLSASSEGALAAYRFEAPVALVEKVEMPVSA